jgi:hypothetical protein
MISVTWTFRAKLIFMDSNVTALERAFSLAKSGACTTVGEIRIDLKAEGYTIEQITGSALSRQLKAVIDEHRAERRWRPVHALASRRVDRRARTKKEACGPSR